MVVRARSRVDRAISSVKSVSSAPSATTCDALPTASLFEGAWPFAEHSLLSTASHPFLLKLAEAFQDAYNLYMILEFVQGGEVYRLMCTGQLDLESTRYYAASVVAAGQAASVAAGCGEAMGSPEARAQLEQQMGARRRAVARLNRRRQLKEWLIRNAFTNMK